MITAQTRPKKRSPSRSKKKKQQRLIRLSILAITILTAGLFFSWVFLSRVEIRQSVRFWWQKKSLPPAIMIKIAPQLENQKDLEGPSVSASAKLPIEINFPTFPQGIGLQEAFWEGGGINLAVPFTPQAPYAIWDDLHKEACEEASTIMLSGLFQGKKEIDKETAELEIQKLVAWEKDRFGYFEDTTAAETAVILQEYFGIKNTRAVNITSIEDIKKELIAGRPVLVPAAGQLLKNPYYRQPGPLYHMLVIKGYTQDGRFITNDPGTRWGADFTYESDVLYNAIHDWNGGDVYNGKKVMIVVGVR